MNDSQRIKYNEYIEVLKVLENLFSEGKLDLYWLIKDKKRISLFDHDIIDGLSKAFILDGDYASTILIIDKNLDFKN